MKRNLDVTQGAKAGSDVDNVDFGTKEHGARDMDALHQVLECQEQELTKLLTSFDLATDGSHHQRAHCFHDDWMSKKKSKCTKTAPEVQTDGSDNDHKADSANPSFLATLPLSELRNLLLSWGKSGDGDHRVLEDRLIECHRQEQGLPSGSDHSNSDEDEVMHWTRRRQVAPQNKDLLQAVKLLTREIRERQVRIEVQVQRYFCPPLLLCKMQLICS